jgi:hypothetical protein
MNSNAIQRRSASKVTNANISDISNISATAKALHAVPVTHLSAQYLRRFELFIPGPRCEVNFHLLLYLLLLFLFTQGATSAADLVILS